MIVQKSFLGKLKDFGLNTYESKIWAALLSREISTAGELSDISDVPRSRSYDVLESLEKKGFVVTKQGKPIKYIAVPPKEVLERMKKRVKKNSQKQIDLIEQFGSTEVLTELNDLYKKGIDMVEPSELTGSIKGRPNIYNHLESMIKNSKKSVIISTTKQGLERKQNTLKNAVSQARKRGVKVRIAAPFSKDNPKSAFSDLAEIKNVDLKSRFCVIDGKEVMFMVLDDAIVHPSYDLGIWINAEFLAKSLENIFDSEWRK